MDRQVALQRILRGRPATLRFTLLDSDGSPIADDPQPAVTVQVDRADGTAVLAAGTATTSAGAGVYTRALTAAQTSSLDLLVATWTDTVSGTTTQTLHEVVGGYWFSVKEARDSDPTLADTSKYPTQSIIDIRTEVEDEAERIIGAAFVPRYRRLRLNGIGTPALRGIDQLVRSIRTVRVYSTPSAYTAFTAGELAALVTDDEGLITRNDSGVFESGLANVVLEYEHGYDRPPTDLKRAALTRLRHRLNAPRSGIPDRATSFVSGEGGTFRLDTAGPEKTGIPDVDAVYGSYAARHGGRGSDGPVSRTMDFDPQRLSLFHGGRR